MEKNNNAMTIEDLASLIQRTMASKEDITELRTETKGILKDMAEELNATHADVAYMRRTLDPLVRNDIAQDEAIEDLASQVRQLKTA